MTLDARWHRDQIDRYAVARPRYIGLADALREVLARAADDADAPGAIVQARAKSIASFAEKAARKAAKYRDPATELTDLCGVRVITHTPSEVNRVCAYIEAHFDVDRANSQDLRGRLKASEFGYLSVHFVVRLRPGVDLGVQVPEECQGLAAEIQVRTLLQHVWADVSHDRLYKNDFVAPQHWQRMAARLAAVLEDADHAFEQLAGMIDAYRREHGAYMTQAQLEDELGTLAAVLAYDPGRIDVALRLARVARAGGLWDRVIATLEPHAQAGNPAVQRELGHALCQRSTQTTPERERGQALLAAAVAAAPSDAEAAALLAATWRGIDDARAHDLYRRAFELDPDDPYLLAAFLELELRLAPTPSVSALLRPTIDAAIARCQTHAELGLHLPFAHFAAARLHLLVGRRDASLEAFVRGLAVTLAEGSGVPTHVLDGELRFLERIGGHREALEGWDQARRLLLCASWLADPDRRLSSGLCQLVSGPALPSPLIVVAVDGARPTIAEVVRGGLAGLDATLVPAAASVGTGVAGALQLWIDALVQGVLPAQVRLLGAGGGAAAALEYRIALALGAQVGLVVGSGGEADRVLGDPDWKGRACAIPAEALMVRAFVQPESGLAEPLRERVGEAVHERYRAQRAREQAGRDASLAPWASLDAGLRESSRQQADDIADKLTAIGRTVEPAPAGEAPGELTPAEIETLAQLEHARWTIERLRSGWRLGDKDIAARHSPYLVTWAALPEPIRDYDREAVRAIPALLASVGLRIAFR